jgi:hypothetical protein
MARLRTITASTKRMYADVLCITDKAEELGAGIFEIMSDN